MAFVASTAEARSRKRKPEWQRQTTIEMITRVNDYWQQHHTHQVRSFWDEAAYHTGNMEAYRLLEVARWKNYSEDWARHNRWQGARETDPAKWRYRTYGEGHDFVLFGDWQICFQTYLDLYAMNPDAFKIQRAIEVMDYEVRSPQTDYWWWADALYMVMPVFTKLYKATGEVKYLDKLTANYRWADSLMWDADAHLYYRDGRYVYPKHKTNSGSKDFWARGDGWVLAGLAKVLQDMPADYRDRPFFEARFKALAEAVAACQRPEGHWTRSMLDPNQAEGYETSGTAFFTYGLLWGMNHGLLDVAKYKETTDRSWRYLTEVALQPSGAVGYVQPIGDRAIPGQYLNEKNEANFGVGAFLLAACEKVRFDDRLIEGSNASEQIVVGVTNESDEYREQVVEIDLTTICEELGISGGRQFVVRDAMNMEVPYQLSHDGKLLLLAGVRPQSTLKFTIRRGTPHTYPTVCYGRAYNERKDDYAWENDRTCYRAYGPALQRTGERSFGIDVWAKNTPQLVVEQFYYNEEWVGQPLSREARKQGRNAQADSLYNVHSYHRDHGQGMDLYKVGPTLGCGAPALIVDGSIVYPYCYEKATILDNGPLRTAVQLDFGKTAVGGDSITEHRIITLDRGSNYTRCTVWYDGITHPQKLATGIVLHSEETKAMKTARDYLIYADPTDWAEAKSCQMFVGTLFPTPPSQVKPIMFDKPSDGSDGHLLGIVDKYSGQRYTYYFGSAWSKHDVRTLDEWRLRTEWTLRSLRQPLKVKFM